MTDVEEQFQALLKELGADAERVPKNLGRLIHLQGVIIGIKIGTEALARLNDTAELLDVAKKLLEKGDS
ncbi:MAG TPA: hypothetical protein ENI27_04620 [bacterium]|nr:hypothetical protein [bacterium]